MMKLWANSLIFGAALSAGLLLFAGCQKNEVVNVVDDTTTAVPEAAQESTDDINLDDILVVDVPEGGEAAVTGSEAVSGATTGSDFQFDNAATGGDIQFDNAATGEDAAAVNIEVIEDVSEAGTAPVTVPSAFFFK